MRYTEIVVYRRDGGRVIPVRISRTPLLPNEQYERELDMAEMFRGHTAWVSDQIREARRRADMRHARVVTTVEQYNATKTAA